MSERATATAGPWAYQATAGDHDFAVYDEASGRDLALVRDFHEANARLIAAAPDLLALVERLLAYEDDRPLPGTFGAEVYADAEALLARVQGEG